jgi:N6-adenosine-specific RNA methylase IME4
VTTEIVVSEGRIMAFSNSLRERAAEIEREHEAACGYMAEALRHAIKAGELLLETKAELDGGWTPWLRSYCPNIPDRTARLYIQLYIHRDEIIGNALPTIRSAVEFLTKKNREAKVALKKDRREQRVIELAEATERESERLGEKLYGVIYIDPPWKFIGGGAPSGMMKAADNHYPCMNLEALKTLKIPAAPNCAMFMWVTVPMSGEVAPELTKAWDFKFKSKWYWYKGEGGQGYWAVNTVEELWICTRGKVPCPAPGDQPPQLTKLPELTELTYVPRGDHSVKPDIFAEHIERLYPNVPKLEMFSRKKRPGWDVWGNEVSSEPVMLSPASNVAPVEPALEDSVKKLFLAEAPIEAPTRRNTMLHPNRGQR